MVSYKATTNKTKDLANVGAIAVSEHLQVVRVTPTEFAANLELTQNMVAQNFDLNSRKFTNLNESQQIRNATIQCDDGREAMLVRASRFKPHTDKYHPNIRSVMYSEHMIDSILETRRAEYRKLVGYITTKVDLAHWLDINHESRDCQFYREWRNRVNTGKQLGDAEVTNRVMSIISNAPYRYRADNEDLWWSKKNNTCPPKPAGKCTKAAYTHMDDDVYLLRATMSILTRLGEELVKQTRSIRFIEAVRDIQSFSINPSYVITCAGCSRTGLLPNGITVLTRCGHQVCNLHCLKVVKSKGGTCPMAGCDAASRRIQLASGSDLIGNNNSKTVYGTKLDRMMQVLDLLPKNEKVLIFIQLSNLMDTVRNALEDAGISFMDLQNQDSSKDLEQFQSDPSIKVLLLNIGDSSASGR
jgi:hypothetical protein